MGILVEVDMYSGLPNPRYELDGIAEKKLIAALSAQRQTATERPASVDGHLGYRGLRIYPIGQNTLRPFHVFDGVIESVGGTAPSSGFIDVDAQFETLLLSLAQPGLRPEEYAYAQGEIEKNATGGVEKAGDDYLLEKLPVYEPNRWNDDLTVLQNNNCYNYANDLVTNTFAQPGLG
jgi:hypothetical protein